MSPAPVYAPPEKPESWHLDKKVPIGLIVALMVQFGAGAMWLSRIEGRIAEAISTNIEQQADIAKLEGETRTMAVGAERVATQLEGLRESLIELKDSQRETNTLLRRIAQPEATP